MIARLAAVALLAFFAAGTAAASAPPVEYWDDPQDQPPLDTAVKILRERCPALNRADNFMVKVRPTWAIDPGHIDVLSSLGWHQFVVVEFFVKDRDALFAAYGPPSVSSSWAPDRVEYWIGGGPHSGILARDIMAAALCGQPMPFAQDRLILLPPQPQLVAPPSSAGAAKSP